MNAKGRAGLANVLCAALIATVLTAPLMAMLTPPQTGEAIAVFAPGTAPTDAYLAAAASGARDIRLLAGGHAVRIKMPDGGPSALRAQGALLVISPVFAAGCSAMRSAQSLESAP